ncbi:MAG: hypothetical protein Kow0042_21620 [Calditrichia bacterium]
MKGNILLKHRTLYAIIIIGLVFLSALNFFGWLFLQGFKTGLTSELKSQILHLGKISTRLMNGNDLENIVAGMERSSLVRSYQQLLYDIKVENDLENIVILDPAGRLLVDYRLDYQIGEIPLTFPVQAELLQSAAVGDIPEPLMISSEGQYFLSAYIPIRNDLLEPVAVLVIDVPFEFFNTLNRFEMGTLYVGVSGLLVLIIFALIILFATRRLFRLESQIKEQERLAQMGQMAASVAHEIRNPLSIMRGATDVLKKKYQDSGDELFAYILSEVDRLNRLVENFLRFSKTQKLNIESVSPKAIIEETCRILSDQRIAVNVPDDLPHVRADRDALRQVLINLIQNAVDALHESGRVEISALVSQNRRKQVTIRVEDNGQGIPPEVLKKIWEPFFSTKARGSGLGLTISKQLTEQMGGKIKIHSRENQGTIVQIFLPCA